jgi:hypothetical protein
VDKEWSHSTDLEAADGSPSNARAFVARHLLEHGLELLIDDVQLVTSELATNALSHAHTVFRVTLTGLGDSVLLEVFDGSSTGPVVVIARPLDTHGRGVAIVKALSRDWGSSSSPAGGKVVWASFDRPAA